MNNEAKVRRSTKALKLGDAKVMSFEDIVVARAARAVKDAKVKGKRGRKRKSDALEADEPEPEPEAARAAKEVVRGKKRGRKRKVAMRKRQRSQSQKWRESSTYECHGGHQ
jgi:hypothetical protein